MKTNALPLPLPSLASTGAARSIAARRRVGEVGSRPSADGFLALAAACEARGGLVRALAIWFVHANTWLQERRTIDLLDSQPQAVLEAARGDRFIASG